jgi:hypothetical protein
MRPNVTCLVPRPNGVDAPYRKKVSSSTRKAFWSSRHGASTDSSGFAAIFMWVELAAHFCPELRSTGRPALANVEEMQLERPKLDCALMACPNCGGRTRIGNSTICGAQLWGESRYHTRIMGKHIAWTRMRRKTIMRLY